jgi:hypothetical protein
MPVLNLFDIKEFNIWDELNPIFGSTGDRHHAAPLGVKLLIWWPLDCSSRVVWLNNHFWTIGDEFAFLISTGLDH